MFKTGGTLDILGDLSEEEESKSEVEEKKPKLLRPREWKIRKIPELGSDLSIIDEDGEEEYERPFKQRIKNIQSKQQLLTKHGQLKDKTKVFENPITG